MRGSHLAGLVESLKVFTSEPDNSDNHHKDYYQEVQEREDHLDPIRCGPEHFQPVWALAAVRVR